jgi:hypothetical protein
MLIYGDQIGVVLASSAPLHNGGQIISNSIGIDSEAADSVIVNTGTISGTRYGITGSIGTIVNDGTISGGLYAVDVSGTTTIVADPGAVFLGTVDDRTGDGVLLLAGSAVGSLDITGCFTGFSQISIAQGADWTLEGGVAQLAAGETISGFTQGDTLVLDNFSASSSTYISGTGLVLSNATASETLHLSGLAASEASLLAGSNATTIIAPISTISTYVDFSYTNLTLGSDGYATSLTITNTGTIGNNKLYGGGVSGNGTLTNDGVVTGEVGLSNGTVINTGFIGQSVYLGSGLVVNSGTIQTQPDLVNAISAQTSLTVILEPGSYLRGAVVDAAGNGTLVLAGDSPTPIVFNEAPLHNQLWGFTQISFATGQHDLSILSAESIGNGLTLDGFGSGDTLQLSEATALTASYVTGTGVVLTNADSISTTLAISGGAAADGFVFTTKNSGLEIDITAACFCRGTRIATPRGNVPVERLAIGDMVKTDLGPRPVKWIGTRAYEGAFIAGNHLALPIRIRRHALGFNIPACDVWLSPDHCVYEGGVFIPAWRLVNGVSITQVQAVERVEYFHIELEQHAVIFAGNMPVESFLDADCRQRFHNAHTAPPAPPNQNPCRPRVADGFLLARIQARINARAGLLPATASGALRGCIDEFAPRLRGWAQDISAPEVPVELDVLSGGVVVAKILANCYRSDLRRAGLGSGCHAFDLPAPAPFPLTLRRGSDGACISPGAALAA